MEKESENLPWEQRWKTLVSDEERKLIEKIETCEDDVYHAEEELYKAKKEYSNYKSQRFSEAMKEFPHQEFKTGDSFHNIFKGNIEINRLLLTTVRNSRFFHWDLANRLNSLGVFTILDLVSRPREYYAQPEVLGEKDTLWIEETLFSRGLRFGMQFSAVGLII